MTVEEKTAGAESTTKRLAGKVALITGGARGIGRAMAEVFAAEGADVAVLDLEDAAVKQAADGIAQAHGTQALGIACNVTDHAACDAAVKSVVEKFKKIDILVNNAGITKDGLLMRMSDADWDAVMNVNLKGAFHFTKAVFRPMGKSGGGRIINIASVVGLMGNPGQGNYAASKGGLIAFTKAVAKEYASRKILVNAIAPGFIETPMTDVLNEDVKKWAMDSTPLKRLGKPEEVAKAALFLASEDASYVTGQVIGVNGGMYM